MRVIVLTLAWLLFVPAVAWAHRPPERESRAAAIKEFKDRCKVWSEQGPTLRCNPPALHRVGSTEHVFKYKDTMSATGKKSGKKFKWSLSADVMWYNDYRYNTDDLPEDRIFVVVVIKCIMSCST